MTLRPTLILWIFCLQSSSKDKQPSHPQSYTELYYITHSNNSDLEPEPELALVCYLNPTRTCKSVVMVTVCAVRALTKHLPF